MSNKILTFAMLFFLGLWTTVSVAQNPTSDLSSESSQASSSYMTGYDLETYCQSGYDTDFGYCAGFITGIADLMFEHNLYGFSSCHNVYIRSQQLVDLIKTYLSKNPDQKGRNARLIVAQALSESYPCY